MFSPTPLVLALPARARVATFADGCRAAAFDFVNRVSLQRDKASLAQWLSGPYRSHVVMLARSRTQRMGAASVVPGALERLMDRTRLEVGVGLLRARDAEDSVSFGFHALSAGLVYRCQDSRGEQGWVPVAHPRMRLAERVLSLVAADFLLRPELYAGLYTCEACGKVDIDPECAKIGVCRAHAHRPPAISEIRELAPGYERESEREAS
jgi:hypothetical protein